jgi:hypothetical protein
MRHHVKQKSIEKDMYFIQLTTRFLFSLFLLFCGGDMFSYAMVGKTVVTCYATVAISLLQFILIVAEC